MRKILLLLLCVFGWIRFAEAGAAHRFIFWYPGEAGTTAQAQPLLDAFSAYLASKLPGTTWEARYFSSESEGARYIRANKPAFGIVSQLMFQRYRLGMERLLATRPLPHGKTQERWHVVLGPCDEAPKSRMTYSAEPFTRSDLEQMFSDLSFGQITLTNNLLGMLKDIAHGSCHQAVVSERVWTTVQHAGAWTQSLTARPTAQPLPTPSVVKFPNADTNLAVQLTNVLRGMAKNADGQALLTEMRLAGF